jgi:hypothetical protein
MRSLFVVTALVASFFAGRMPPANALRETEIERDVARDRLKRCEEQAADSMRANGFLFLPPKLGPIAVVASDEKYITIAAGSDDGLKVGDLLDVRQDKLAVASVRVVKASFDRSLVVYCRPEDKGRIAKGDFVYSR